MSNPVLKLENVTMQFGGVVAVDNLSMEVGEGEIVALIGPNGAGKTTAFNVVTGVYAPPTAACISMAGPICASIPPAVPSMIISAAMWKNSQGSPPCAKRRIRSPKWAWPVPSRISVSSAI